MCVEFCRLAGLCVSWHNVVVLHGDSSRGCVTSSDFSMKFSSMTCAGTSTQFSSWLSASSKYLWAPESHVSVCVFIVFAFAVGFW